MRKLTAFLLFTVIAYCSFIGVAVAAGTVIPDDGNILDLARPFYEAIMGGQWWLAAMAGLILATTAAKRYLPGKAGAWVNGEYGQPLTVLLLAFGGAGAAALLAAGPGAAFSGALAYAAFKVALGAAGGYTFLKAFLAPILVKIQAKAPAWMQPLFTVLLWAFSKPAANEVAEKAGDEAVKASLEEQKIDGADTIIGKPTKFE